MTKVKFDSKTSASVLISAAALTQSNVKLAPQIQVAVGWTFSSLFAPLLLFGLFTHVRDGTGISVELAALYNAISRPLWSAVIAWIVVACCSGYGGKRTRFASVICCGFSALLERGLHGCYGVLFSKQLLYLASKRWRIPSKRQGSN